jgi:hypothetical protein
MTEVERLKAARTFEHQLAPWLQTHGAERGNQFVSWPTLILTFSLQEKEQPLHAFHFVHDPPQLRNCERGFLPV